MKSKLRRSLLKTLTWKVFSFLFLILIGVVTGTPLLQIGIIALIYQTATFGLYLAHERLWNKIEWGKDMLDEYDFSEAKRTKYISNR